MLAIRLAPRGKKHHKTFRLVVSEKTKDMFGDYLEDLGSYDPHPSTSVLNFKTDRVKHWLSKGAQTSATVHNLLVEAKIIDQEKLRVWKAKLKKVEIK